MLSRVAENIYWLSRYVERAENTARLVRVNSHLVLDTPTGIAPGWEPLVDIAGLTAEFHSVEREANERNIVRFLIGDANNPGSILSSLAAARENCRTVRDVLPRSSWERLNELHIFAKENIQSGLTKSGRDNFLDRIISGSQGITGLLGSVMYRDEAWDFARIGRNLERADMTTRIIDVRSTDLFPDDMLESRSLDTLQWISVLRSMSGYQVYRRQVAIRVSRGDVLEFLFQDARFPRSFVHCLEAVDESVARIDEKSPALRRIAALKKKVRQTEVAKLDQVSLHAFIDELQLDIMGLHQNLATLYFPPPIQYDEAG
ncbi:MAG: alpha-E domain-containing protein [Gammaproteobacteria bacterium]|nr:alpha-E domain-containing protein [Gammaproteobacteria bacterium]